MTTPLIKFREQYPQFDDFTDKEVADRIRQNYFPKVSEVDFDREFGLSPSDLPEPPPETFSEKLDERLAADDNITENDALTSDPREMFKDFSRGHVRRKLGDIEKKVTGIDFFDNALKLTGERFSKLFGHLVKGAVGAPGKALQKKYGGGEIVFGTDWGEGHPDDGKFRVRYMSGDEVKKLKANEALNYRDHLTETVPEFLKSQDFGGEQKNTEQQIKDAWNRGDLGDTAAATILFGLERGIESIPDMLAVMTGPLGISGYVAARSDEIGEARAQNKGKSESDIVDQLEAAPFAVASALFERFGVTKIKAAFGSKSAEEIGTEVLKAGLAAKAKRVTGKVASAAGWEAATEAFQEGVIEYLGEKFGTDAAMSFAESLERGFFGGLAGGVYGGTAGGIGATGTEILHHHRLKNVPRETYELADPRLKRDVYRWDLADMASELFGQDPQGQKPEWYDSVLPDGDLSTEGVIDAVEGALAGRELGFKQSVVVKSMLDVLSDTRNSPAAIQEARDNLEKARKLRRDAQVRAGAPVDSIKSPDEDNSGEKLKEDDYLPEMSAEARVVHEIALDVDRLGLTAEADKIISESETTAEAIGKLQVLFETKKGKADEQATVTPGKESTTDIQGAKQETKTAGDRRAEARPVDIERRREEDRRRDTELRDKVAGMSIDEQVRQIYKHELTGINNARVLKEDLKTAKAVASIDVDGLGGVNDHLGHSAGDILLKTVAAALERSGVDVYHKSGDEFHAIAETQEELESAIAGIKEDLSRQIIQTDTGELRGVQITVGVGSDLKTADTAMERDKKVRQERGLRNPKGTLPPGGILYSQNIQMSPGSNHVGLIGKLGELPLNQYNEYVLGDGRVVRIPKDPVRRRHIIKHMEREFGLAVYEGRIKGKTRLGFYRTGHGEIRTKNANDLEVTAHELAHWLDDRYPWISRLYNEYESEIKQVSYDVKLLHEGYAEFMRSWLTQDFAARQTAPGFYDAWMEALGSRPELAGPLLEVQEMMHAWFLQGSLKRLQSKIGKNETPLRVRIMEGLSSLPRKFLHRAFDDLRGFKEAERAMNEGIITDATDSGYKALRLARGSMGVTLGVINRGTVNWNEDGDIEFTGDGLMKVFEPVQDKMPEMQLYMVARRAQELSKQGRENLIRPDEMRAGLQLGQTNPEFEQVFDEFQQWNSRMLDFYQDSGILSEKSRSAIEEMNKNYVPFNRIMDTFSGEKVKAGGSPFIRLKGGTHNINDVFENIVGNTARLVRMSMVNRGKANFYEMITSNENQSAALYAAPIPKDVKPVNIDRDQVRRKVLEALGMDPTEVRIALETGMGDPEVLEVAEIIEEMTEGLEEMVTFFQPGQDPSGDVDFFYDQGEKKFFEIKDSLLWDSIQSLGPRNFNFAANVLGGFANALRTGVTFTPTFQIANFIRDTGNAFTLSKGQIVPAASALKALTERIYNDNHYWEYMINGGGFSSIADADGINRDKISVIDSPAAVMRQLERGLSAFEYANRLAEFKSLVGKGYSKREAALGGREISSDFAMRGSSDFLRWFTVSIPFLNARLQGLYRNAREVVQLPDGTSKMGFMAPTVFSYALRSMMAITIPSLILYMFNKDDERYQELPDWIRDLYWVIFSGDEEDEYALIPKPFETGMLWGTVPERTVEYMYKGDEKELADSMLWMATQTFNLDFMPQAYKVWDDLKKNKKFTGAPIVPQYLEGVEPSEQYHSYTSDAMIALGRKLGVSPIKAEYIVRGHFGTLGAYALGVSDMLVGDINNSGEKPTKGWKDNILISRFFNDGPLKRTHSEEHFYEMLKDTREIVNTVRLMSRRSPERLEEYFNGQKKMVLLGLNQALEAASKELRAIDTGMDMIRADPALSGDEKREQLFELRRARNQITREMHDNINPEVVQQLLDAAEQAESGMK